MRQLESSPRSQPAAQVFSSCPLLFLLKPGGMSDKVRFLRLEAWALHERYGHHGASHAGLGWGTCLRLEWGHGGVVPQCKG